MRNMLKQVNGNDTCPDLHTHYDGPFETFLSYSNYRSTSPPPPPQTFPQATFLSCSFIKVQYEPITRSSLPRTETDLLSVLRNGHNSQTLHPCAPPLQTPKRHRRHNRAIPNEPIKPPLALPRCQITLEEGAVPSIRRYNHHDRRRDV